MQMVRALFAPATQIRSCGVGAPCAACNPLVTQLVAAFSLTIPLRPATRYSRWQPSMQRQQQVRQRWRTAAGCKGLPLHHGGTPYLPSCSYHCRDGEMHNGMVVAAFALTDVNPGDGGFVAVGVGVGVHRLPSPVSRSRHVLNPSPGLSSSLTTSSFVQNTSHNRYISHISKAQLGRLDQ